uniref:Uncharacterized protein n=1 Tax=Cuerna arida TaxID=1464854 RepID=A0A1B6ESQ4_9HEMI
MNIYFHWFTFCLFFKTYVMGISIHNFRPINMSELTQLVGPQAEKILRKVIPRAGKSVKSDEASEEQPLPLPSVFRDEKKNVFFDLWVIRGRENRLMGDNKGQLCVSIQSSPEVKDSLNLELWRFISNVLQVRRDDIEIILSNTNDMARRIVVMGRAITESECRQRLYANMRSFSLEVQEEAGAEESAKLDTLFFHAEIKSKQPTGPAPEESEERDLEWKPNYIKNPTMLDRVLRDLMPNKEIIIRGRLLKKDSPNFIARPLLENYQGHRSLKVKRKVLEGVHNQDEEKKRNFPAGPRMTCPGRILGLSVIDTLSQDGDRVISRRVFAPLFRNETHDFVDELDYTEVKFKTSM